MGPIEDLEPMDIDEAARRYKHAAEEYRKASEEYQAASTRFEAAHQALSDRSKERYAARQNLINVAEGNGPEEDR